MRFSCACEFAPQKQAGRTEGDLPIIAPVVQPIIPGIFPAIATSPFILLKNMFDPKE